MRRHAILAMLAICATSAWAQGPVAPVDPLDDWKNSKEREKDAPLGEFRLINYFFTRLTATNQLGDPSGLRGVSLGPLGIYGGSATRVGPNTETGFIEQRWIPVIEYTPFFADDLATFRAQFEIDFMYGLAANTVLQNQGGGLNADMVNLQTKNLNVSLYPTRKPSELSIVLGTQSFYDNVNDPTRTPVFDIVRGGYKLAFLGTDGTGASIFWSPIKKLKTRLAFLPIGAGQPDKAMYDDARLKFVWMGLIDASYEIQPGTTIGASAWVLRDDSKGAAYAFEGLVFSGPASTALYGFTGAPRIAIESPTGTVAYGGVNFQHNPGFHTGDFAAAGWFMMSAGQFTSARENTLFNKQVSVLGFAANAEVLYKWGRTNNDLITAEGLFSSGDSNTADDKYTGVFTSNFYGLPGAVWFNHRSLILFPFTSTVNNYTGAVTDISNQGYGVTAGILTGAYDLIPNTLNLKLGTAAATANANPAVQPNGTQPGRFMGLEVNAELKWTIRYLMTVGLHGAYMFRGSFYDGSDRVTANPWALFSTFTWYAF